jgi:cytochrome c oxidase assembly protein subunit 15
VKKLAGERIPHLAAIAVAIVTLPLIFMGGLVTSTGAGLSVPDWPTSFGYSMFSLPFGLWRGPVFTEHSHRILGATVGILAILSLAASLVFETRRSVRILAGVVLVLVSCQGVLGGMRVRLVEHGLAPIHGSFAQAVFAVMAALVTVTSFGWRHAPPLEGPAAEIRRLRKLAIALVGLAYLQVLLGAWYRHTAGARLEPHAANAFAILALAHVLVRGVKRAAAGNGWVVRSGKLLHGLLGSQILLGIVSWKAKESNISIDWKVGLVSSHLVLGALVLATTVALALKLHRDDRARCRSLVDPIGSPERTKPAGEPEKIEAVAVGVGA